MRALRNAALRYLVRTGEPIMLALAEKQFDGADNMTDSIAALSILSDFDLPARNQVFERFFLRWQRNALVMDKWLSLQALSSLADTLDTVQRLMQHPVFSLKSPNKVRALVGAFAHGNQLRFHTADGAGYKLVADTVLALDPLNPQAASRLVSAFESWRRFDPGRQVLIQTELKRIAKTRTLSPNLTEMVERMLS
jgi:aminopeptidase N